MGTALSAILWGRSGRARARAGGARNAAVEQLWIWVNRAALSPEWTEEVEEPRKGVRGGTTTQRSASIHENAIQRARNTKHDPALAQLDPVLAGRVGAPMHPKRILWRLVHQG